MDYIIIISLPTEDGISLYSSKLVKHTHFYLYTLHNCDMNITFKFSSESVDIPIKNILELSSIEDNIEKIKAYKILYPSGEFHTSSHNIFNLIETTYLKTYGKRIEDSFIYSEYSGLINKVEYTREQINEIISRFSDKTYYEKQVNSKLKSIIEVIEKDPIGNKDIVVKNLDTLVIEYRSKINTKEAYVFNTQQEIQKPVIQTPPQQQQIQQPKQIVKQQFKPRYKPPPVIEEPPPKPKEPIQTSSVISKNVFGQLVHNEYNLVYEPKQKKYIGMATETGVIIPINPYMINICKEKGLRI